MMLKNILNNVIILLVLISYSCNETEVLNYDIDSKAFEAIGILQHKHQFDTILYKYWINDNQHKELVIDAIDSLKISYNPNELKEIANEFANTFLGNSSVKKSKEIRFIHIFFTSNPDSMWIFNFEEGSRVIYSFMIENGVALPIDQLHITSL